MNLKLIVLKSVLRFFQKIDLNYTELNLEYSGRTSGWFIYLDLSRSDLKLKLVRGFVPLIYSHLQVVLSQHFIEHLETENELPPLLYNLNTNLTTSGVIILSTSNRNIIAQSYLNQKLDYLISSRKTSFKDFSLNELQDICIVNFFFIKKNRNLYHLNYLVVFIHLQIYQIQKRLIRERDLIMKLLSGKAREGKDYNINANMQKFIYPNLYEGTLLV